MNHLALKDDTVFNEFKYHCNLKTYLIQRGSEAEWVEKTNENRKIPGSPPSHFYEMKKKQSWIVSVFRKFWKGCRYIRRSGGKKLSHTKCLVFSLTDEAKFLLVLCQLSQYASSWQVFLWPSYSPDASILKHFWKPNLEGKWFRFLCSFGTNLV